MQEDSEAQQHHIGILLFGDSVDYRIARSFCNAALGHGLEHMTDDGVARHHNLTGVSVKSSPELTAEDKFSAIEQGKSSNTHSWRGALLSVTVRCRDLPDP